MVYLLSIYEICFCRCTIPSELALHVSGLMNTAGKKGWRILNEESVIHTAVKEKTSPGELTVITDVLRGELLIIIL